MVRTKQQCGGTRIITMGGNSKIMACKAAMAAASLNNRAASSSSSTPGKSKLYSGGNPIHPREIPEWQKSITCFFRPVDVEGESLPTPAPEAEPESELDMMQAGPSGS